MVRTAGVVSRLYRGGGGGKRKETYRRQVAEKKVRPLESCPLRSALLLTEIASKAGPTKNSLDFIQTFRTIVFLQ